MSWLFAAGRAGCEICGLVHTSALPSTTSLSVRSSVDHRTTNHGAQLQFHTGRHSLEGAFPTIGSWVHYGLGSLNDNLPQFVVLGTPLADSLCAGVNGHGSWLSRPEAYNGIRMNVDPANPLPFASPGPGRFREEQRAEFGLLGKLNRLAGIGLSS